MEAKMLNTIKLHEYSYMMLREMAKEQNRKLIAIMDMLILAEWLKTHPQPVTTEEEIGRR
jgi:hypothetical protein